MTELVPENDVDGTNNVKESATEGDITADGGGETPVNEDSMRKKKKKKKSGAFGIFRAALMMMRKRPEGKAAKKTVAKQKSTATNGSWAKLVGSMRPLSLQETAQSPPHQPSPAPAGDETTLPQNQPPAVSDGGAAEEITPPPQEEPSAADYQSVGETITPASPAASSSCGTMSQYASTSSLRDLYCSSDEEEDDPDEVFEAITGDEMIDAKAEEFIAQFYKQIQLQNTAKTHHHHRRCSAV